MGFLCFRWGSSAEVRIGFFGCVCVCVFGSGVMRG